MFLLRLSYIKVVISFMFRPCIVYKIISYKVVLSLVDWENLTKKVDSARIILTKDIWGQKGSCRTLKKVSEMLGTPTSQLSVISKEGLKCSFFYLKFQNRLHSPQAQTYGFLFELKIDSLTSTNSFIKRFVKNKNSAINHWSFCKLLELNCNLLNYMGPRTGYYVWSIK